VTNKEAIIVLKNIAWFGKIYDQEQTEEAIHIAINALQAQEKSQELSNNSPELDSDSGDTISRQDAISAHCELCGDRGKCNCDICPDVEVFRLIPSQPKKRTEERTETHACDCISRQKVRYKLTALVNELEEIFAHIRERNVDDSVCGLCEYDGAYIGQSGDWCNECPGFNRDDCFKLKEKYREEWLKIDG